MFGRRERHRRRVRGGGWPVYIAIKPWAVVRAFFATGVLRQSAGPFHFASRAWQVENLVEIAKRRAAAPALPQRRPAASRGADLVPAQDEEGASGPTVGSLLLAARGQVPTCSSRWQSRSERPPLGRSRSSPDARPPGALATTRSVASTGAEAAVSARQARLVLLVRSGSLGARFHRPNPGGRRARFATGACALAPA